MTKGVRKTSPEIAPAIFREAKSTDAVHIARIYNHYIHNGETTLDPVEKTEAGVRLQLIQMAPREAIMVMEYTGQCIGWGAIKAYSQRPGYHTTCETSIYLDPDYRNRGLGKRLKSQLIEKCRHFGYHHLVAKITTQNQACIALNRQLGYEQVGIQREIGYVNGRWIDVVIMQLVLP